MSLKPGEITNKFSLTYPAKFEVVERWIVYIIDEDGDVREIPRAY